MQGLGPLPGGFNAYYIYGTLFPRSMLPLVAVTALPVRAGHTQLAGRYVNAPVIGIAEQFHPAWLRECLVYLVAALAAATLVAAANSAMMCMPSFAMR